MKVHLDCIPCFLKQSLEAARMATDDKEIQERVMKEVLKYLQQINYENSPPVISREVHHIIRSITKNFDPYKKVKETSNSEAQKIIKKIQNHIDTSDDPILSAIKFAIVGNVIDFGTMQRINVNDMIKHAIEKDIDAKDYPLFKKTLDQSKNILYLADNAGEIFFDKILIEKLYELDKKITYVIKENPIINDALFDDVKASGIDKIAEVITYDKGQIKSTPGVVLPYASKEFVKLFDSSDMVISKGQGNYEGLSNSKRMVFFLLVAKCQLVAEDLQVPIRKMVLKANK